MSELTESYASSALLLLGDWSLRWGVLIVLLYAGLAVWRPKRVATRLALCRFVLAGGLLLPFLPHCWGPTRAPASPSSPALPLQPEGSAAPARSPGESPLVSAPPEFVEGSSPPSPVFLAPVMASQGSLSVTETTPVDDGQSFSIIVIIITLWLAGVVLMLARLVLGWFWLAWLRFSANKATAESLDLLAQCRTEMSLERDVTLRMHAAVQAPILIGGLRPVILVPVGWEELPIESRRAALFHELAHLAHYDEWAKLGDEIVRAVFFFHPLVGWLLSRIDGERERRCDGDVVRQGIEPREFAQVLLEFANRLRPGKPAITLGTALPLLKRVTLKDRVNQLLEDDLARTITPLSRVRWAGLATAVLGVSIALGSFGLRAAVLADDTPDVSPVPQKPSTIPGLVSGFVKDSDDNPVAGATVLLSNSRTQDRPLLVQTGADGSFAFTKIPVMDNLYAFKLVAGKAGYAPVLDSASDDSNEPRNTQKLLKLSKTATVSGFVRDPQGQPVSGARVEFGVVERYGNMSTWGYTPIEAVRGTDLESFLFTRTDNSGRFQFATVPADKELIFCVRTGSFAHLDTGASRDMKTYRAGPKMPPVELRLTPGGRIQGRVVSQVRGVKLGGLHVWLVAHPEMNLQTWTNPDGTFQFDGLPAGTFLAQMDDSSADMRWTLKSAPSVSVETGKTTDVRLELVEGVVVEGKVIADDTGKPIARAAVGGHGPAKPGGPANMFRVKTDADGRYSLRLPPGDTQFYVQTPPRGYAPLGGKSVVIPDDVRTLAGPTLTVTKMKWSPIEGQVLDAQGKPVARAEIVAIRWRTTLDRLAKKVVTDEQGHFRLTHGPDGAFFGGATTGLQIELPGGRVFEERAIATAKDKVVVVLPTLMGEDGKGLDNVLPDELAGTVVDLGGKPLEGVHVHVWDRVDRPENQAVTGKDGVFRIKNCGRGKKVQVRFRKPGYSPVMFMQQPVGAKGLLVAMDQKTYFFGTVFGLDGQPVANAVIRANQGPKNGAEAIITSIWTETKSDASGRYRLYVEPDAYEFLVKAPGVGVARLPKRPIAHGEPQRLDIQLQPVLADGPGSAAAIPEDETRRRANGEKPYVGG